MEQVFSQKIFRKKRNTSRGIPVFSFSPELPENHCIIYFITLVPCSLAKKISDFAREWRPPSCLSVQKKEYLQRYSIFFVFTGITGKSLYHLLYHTSTMLLGNKNKRFRSRMAPSFIICKPASHSAWLAYKNNTLISLNNTLVSLNNTVKKKLTILFIFISSPLQVSGERKTPASCVISVGLQLA